MASNNVIGKVIILLKIPNGGISRTPGIPSDPTQKKGNMEIVSEIIVDGISGTGWEYNGIDETANHITLTYGGE